MKATHVRSITKNRNGAIIFQGEWYCVTPDSVHYLKSLHAAMAPDAKNGQTYHLAYSHPTSVKQRKALEHGQRLRSIKGAAGLIRNVQTKYAKELNLAAPNSNYRLQLVVRLLEEIARDLQRKGPL